MQNPQEQLKEYLDRVGGRIFWLKANLAVLHFLGQINRPEDIESYNSFSNFFSFVEDAARSNLVLALDSLFEAPRETEKICQVCNSPVWVVSNGDRSLIWYLDQMKEHSSSFAAPNSFSNAQIDGQKKQIESYADQIETIGVYRDKWYAHRDKKYFDNPQKLWGEIPLTNEDLETLVSLASGIIGEHLQRLENIDINWAADQIVGIDAVFVVIHMAREMGPDATNCRIELNKLRKYVDETYGKEDFSKV